MAHHPSFPEYAALARTGRMVPVFRQLVGDSLTPVSAFDKLRGEPWAFLFESVIGGEKVGRYSFLGADPFLQFQASGSAITITEAVRAAEAGSPRPTGGPSSVRRSQNAQPLDELQRLIERHRAVHLAGLPRFCGGAVGYAGYDAVRYTEHLPDAPPDDRGLPDLAFALYDRMVIFDHINKTVLAVVHARPGDGAAPAEQLEAGYAAACRRVDALVETLDRPTVPLKLTDIQPAGAVNLPFRSNFTRPAFEDAVRRCQELIRAGDIFQVVLSQRLETRTSARPFDIYRTLRVVNPSPFMFYLQQDGLHLIGSSPEIMVRVEDETVTIRPLAGTRRRGQDEAEDAALAAELLADPKERAEHIMLVDLGRNDVGRVARYNSVKLSDVMAVERYSHVMHICSNVSGRLAEGKTAFDALRACLPAGTLSGAPKVRAMQIIDAIEPHRRGPYGGAVGYIDFTGNMDTCIALRTLVLQDGVAYVQAGAGIVADSEPDREYEETLNKARGLLRAIEIAQTQF